MEKSSREIIYNIYQVQQLADLLERDLGLSDGWLLHKLCKVRKLSIFLSTPY